MNVDKFIIDEQESAEAYVFYLSGELDLSAASHLRSALKPIVHQVEKVLVFDLKGLTYIDSTGIGIIISVLKARDELKAAFIVREIPVAIQRLFDLTGISKFLNNDTSRG